MLACLTVITALVQLITALVNLILVLQKSQHGKHF